MGNFLVTYLLHSTVILALTLGLLKLPAFRAAAVRDVALRFALIAGLFTAAFSPLPRPGVPLLPSAPSVRAMVSGERALAEVTHPGLPATVPQPPAASLPAVDWAAALLLASALFAAFRLSAAFILVRRGRGDRVGSADLRARVERLASSAGCAGDIAVFWTHFQVPCATGLRSILLPHDLPQRLSAPELDAVLAHECAHLLRRDPLWQVGLSLMTQCLWFQPLNLLALSAWRDASEECCDAWAAQHAPRLTLAQAIVTLAGPRPSSAHRPGRADHPPLGPHPRPAYPPGVPHEASPPAHSGPQPITARRGSAPPCPGRPHRIDHRAGRRAWRVRSWRSEICH